VFESNTGWGDGIGASKQGTGASEIPTFTVASGRLAICALAVNKSSGAASRIRNDQATLSVDENLISGTSLKVYPNPVSSILTIESDSNSEKEISVINTLGQVIFKTKSKSTNTQLDMQSLNVSGLVLVQVIEDGKVSTHKVIVK
jgi:Secretion system C-terminal sorting domain